MKKYVALLLAALFLLSLCACSHTKVNNEEVASGNKLVGQWYYFGGNGDIPTEIEDYEIIEIKQNGDAIEICWPWGSIEEAKIISDTVAALEATLITGEKCIYFYEYTKEDYGETIVVTYKDPVSGELFNESGVICKKEAIYNLFGERGAESVTNQVPAVNASGLDEELIREILTGQKAIFDFESGQETMLMHLKICNNKYAGTPVRYAVLDLDGDGTQEMMVEFDQMGDTAVIHMENGKAMAYYIPFRGRINVKTDGTMIGSSGAANSSVHKLAFTNPGMQYVDVIGTVEEQDLKADVPWYDIY